MGTAWQYQPQNEIYKSGGAADSLLVETRAKGGNLLLNVGPKPDGELPIEQEERLREMALWMFVNSEAIYGVRPWVITNEQDIWFTKKKDADTLYAMVKQKTPWKRGYVEGHRAALGAAPPRRPKSACWARTIRCWNISPTSCPRPRWKQEADGLHIRAMRAQRLQDNSKWPNPVVLKITDVKPALKPPQVVTSNAKWAGGMATFSGELKEMGSAVRWRWASSIACSARAWTRTSAIPPGPPRRW